RVVQRPGRGVGAQVGPGRLLPHNGLEQLGELEGLRGRHGIFLLLLAGYWPGHPRSGRRSAEIARGPRARLRLLPGKEPPPRGESASIPNRAAIFPPSTGVKLPLSSSFERPAPPGRPAPLYWVYRETRRGQDIRGGPPGEKSPPPRKSANKPPR